MGFATAKPTLVILEESLFSNVRGDRLKGALDETFLHRLLLLGCKQGIAEGRYKPVTGNYTVRPGDLGYGDKVCDMHYGESRSVYLFYHRCTATSAASSGTDKDYSVDRLFLERFGDLFAHPAGVLEGGQVAGGRVEGVAKLADHAGFLKFPEGREREENLRIGVDKVGVDAAVDAVEVSLYKNILAGDVVGRPYGAGAAGNAVRVAEGNESAGADEGDLGLAEIADRLGGNDVVARLDLQFGLVGLT